MFAGQCNLAWLSPVILYSALFHRPARPVLLFTVFLYSRLERGSPRTNQHQKTLCPPASENTLALFPPFVCLPPTYTQREHESFPCLQLSTMLHLCAPAHTPEYRGGAPRTSPSIWAHSLSRTPSRLCLTLLFFICRFLLNSLSQSPSFSPSISYNDDLTQHPHYGDFIGQQLQSRPQSEVLVEGTINTATVSGTPG